MITRLCLLTGVLSPRIPLVWASNNGPRWQLDISAHLSPTTCEISVCGLDTDRLLCRLTFENILRLPSLRAEIMQLHYGLDDLRSSVHAREFLRLDEGDYFQILHRAYSTELEYLKTAYVAPVRSNPRIHSKAPSERLFGQRYGEVDRTMTGLNALRWIHQDDYNSYTSNQRTATKLTLQTFAEMRALFCKYTTSQEILTLIMMQMTNDLGKSTDLQNLYYQHRSGTGDSQVNHDMMMYFAVRDRPDLVPSFQRLPHPEQKLVQKLLCVSAEFNPAQLVQAECPPEVMSILQEHLWSTEEIPEALDRKFLELFLDLSGALGQVDHEGAMTMTEPVVRSLLHALEVSKCVAEGKMTAKKAYYRVLMHRLQILEELGWTGVLDIENDDIDFAKARILCMGRVDNLQKASLFEGVIDNLPVNVKQDLAWGLRIDHNIARQATYMPGMIANIDTPKQLEALLRYLARILYISDADLMDVPRNDDGTLPENLVILERDVMPIIKPLLKEKKFQHDPLSLINDSTPLPPLQILKRSSDRHVPLVGDRPPHRSP